MVYHGNAVCCLFLTKTYITHQRCFFLIARYAKNQIYCFVLNLTFPVKMMPGSRQRRCVTLVVPAFPPEFNLCCPSLRPCVCPCDGIGLGVAAAPPPGERLSRLPLVSTRCVTFRQSGARKGGTTQVYSGGWCGRCGNGGGEILPDVVTCRWAR